MKFLNTIVFSFFLIGSLFLFSAPADASQAECSNRVLFPNVCVKNFYRSSVFELWTGWEPVYEDWSHNAQLSLWGFLQNCFDNYSEGIMQVVLKNTTLYPDMNFAVVLHADVTNNGYLYQDEVEHIHELGRSLPLNTSIFTTDPRVKEYIEHLKPVQSLLYINHSSPSEFGVQQGQDYSGTVLRLSDVLGVGDQANAKAYLDYDIYTGYIQYELPLMYAWENFPEIGQLTDQYTRAAKSVSLDCSSEFTETDLLRGILLPSGDWSFRITSSRESCPPSFSSTITVQDRTDMGIKNIDTFGTQTVLPHTPNIFLFPCGIITTSNFQHIFFQYFTSALGVGIMIVGLVLFGAHLIHAMYAHESNNIHKQKKVSKKK